MGSQTSCQNNNCLYPKYNYEEYEENKAAVKIQNQLRVKAAVNQIPVLILEEIREYYDKHDIKITQLEPSQFNGLLKQTIANTLDTLKSFEFIQDDDKGNGNGTGNCIEDKRQLYVIPCLQFSIKNSNECNKDIDISSGNRDDNYLCAYRGQWNCRGLKHGVGILIENDSSVYYGHFLNDKKKGKGILIKSNGDYYKGDFDNDEVHGQGTLDIYSEYQYIGQWLHNSKHGIGTEVYPDGSVYKGEFANNLKQGNGVYTYSNGSYYEGQFHNSLFHGKGKFAWKDGRKYVGNFSSGKIEGTGEFTWPNGCKYQGEYKNMVKQGKGILTFPHKTTLDGYWLQNKLHGKVEVHDREVYETCYRYGKMISSNQKRSKMKHTNTHNTNGNNTTRVTQKIDLNENLSYRIKSFTQSKLME